MEWREVPRFPGYRVSEFGHLTEGGETLVAERDRYGYRFFHLTRVSSGRSRSRRRLASNLVASAYLGITDERRRVGKIVIRHLDGNVENDHHSNLAPFLWTEGLPRFEAGILGLSESQRRTLRVEYLGSLKNVAEKSVIIPVSSVTPPPLSNKGTVLRKKRRLKPDPSRIIRGGLKTQSGSSWGRECETYTSYRTPRYNRY